MKIRFCFLILTAILFTNAQMLACCSAEEIEDMDLVNDIELILSKNDFYKKIKNNEEELIKDYAQIIEELESFKKIFSSLTFFYSIEFIRTYSRSLNASKTQNHLKHINRTILFLKKLTINESML